MSLYGTYCSYGNYNESVCANYDSVDLSTIELFKGYPDKLLKFATACCIFFMLIGIPGNIITIAALVRYKKVRNATAIFIINLSVSDLTFCSFNLPLSVFTFWQRSWKYGHFLCRIFPFARYTVIAGSIFTILAISVNRYIMIAHPRLYPKIYKPRNIGLIIASIWIFSMGIFVPTWLEKYGRFGLDPKVGVCSILPDEKGRTPKKAFATAAFLLPCAAIVFCYVRIFFIARKTTKKSLPPNKTNDKYEESSAMQLSTFKIIQAPDADSNCNYIVDNAESSVSFNDDIRRNMTFNAKNNKNTQNGSKIGSKLMKCRRTALKRAVARLTMSLPTRKDRRLRTMIIAIMTSFCVCHLPITITQLFVDTTTNTTTCIMSDILMFSSSSIDPIIYVLMSHEYRKAYKNLLHCLNRCILPTTVTNLRRLL